MWDFLHRNTTLSRNPSFKESVPMHISVVGLSRDTDAVNHAGKCQYFPDFLLTVLELSQPQWSYCFCGQKSLLCESK